MIIEIRCEKEREIYGTYEKGEYMPYFQPMQGGLDEGVTRLKNSALSPSISAINFYYEHDEFRLSLEATQEEDRSGWNVLACMDDCEVMNGMVKQSDFITFIDRFVDSFYKK